MSVLNFDIYSQFLVIEDFCPDVLIKKMTKWVVILHVHMWLLYYRPLVNVNYDLLEQEMHRHDFLHASVHPSSAVQPDRESTTSLDLGASCQKSFTHTESDKERLGSLCKTVNKKEYQQRQTCVTDRSVLCG